MPVRSDDPRPPYVQLADELRQAITAGDYEPGDLLPSTRKLAATHGIAQLTVQHALRVLRDEGLVISQAGRGTFVQDPKTPREPSADDRAASLEDKLDAALRMLAETNARLDRLEAGQATSPDPSLDVGPEPAGPEPPGMDV